MNKKYLVLLLALTSFASQSSVLSSNGSMLAELKDTPATRYELGRYKLEMYVFTMKSKLKGERIDKSKFKFESAKVKEVDNQLQIAVTATGRSSHLTAAQCKAAKAVLSRPFNTNKIPYNMWSDLPQESYKKLQSEISLHVILIDKKDPSSTVSC